MVKYIFTFFVLMMTVAVHAQRVADAGTTPPENSMAMKKFNAGVKAFETHQMDMALNNFRQAQKMFPKFEDAYLNASMCFQAMRLLDSAEHELNRCIEVLPKQITAYQRLGVLYSGQRKYDEALQMYQKMIELDTKNPEGFFGAARIQMIKGSYEDAEVNAMKALELYRKDNHNFRHQAKLLLGMIYYYKGDKTNAKKYMKEAQDAGERIPPKIAEELAL